MRLRRSFCCLALTSVALGSAVLVGRPQSPNRSAPSSLILVSIDTLRADRLSIYGYKRPTSPALEGLASGGVVFDNFYYNGGGTLPSHMTLMTSLHPATHGIGPESPRTLDPERETLAESLRAAGYATAAFTGGGWVAAKFGFDQGFERYDESERGFEETLPAAIHWLESLPRERPFFLFLHTYDVHSAWQQLPYDCPGDAELHFAGPPPSGFNGCRGGRCASELLAQVNLSVRAGEADLSQLFTAAELAFISDLYDGCVLWADEQLGRFFETLRSSGLWNRTVVSVLSDHGEEFGEHGQLLHDQGGYEEIARIPWILKLPGKKFAGQRVGGLSAMVDVTPTLLDAVGLPPSAEAQGRSLMRAIPESRTSRPTVHMYSVLRTPEFKYFSDERRLFRLSEDPTEAHNLFEPESLLIAELERRVRDLIAIDHAAAAEFAGHAGGPSTVILSAEEIARLRALGYLR